MTSLPSTVPGKYINNPHIISAYNKCTTLEKALQQSVNRDNLEKNLMFIRILGYLIRCIPTPQGLNKIKDEIFSCPTDEVLLELGKMYFDYYIRAFRATKGRIPTPSNHVSRLSFDTIADMVNDTLVQAPQSHSTAKNNALIRDGFRCVLTGTYDAHSFDSIRELREKLELDSTLSRGITHCAHIFSESTNLNIEPESAKQNYAASMWDIMQGFGYSQLSEELNGSKVHRLENVLTLASQAHADFDSLKIWFAETRVQNKYKIEATHNVILRGYAEYVTFTTSDPQNLPVPSRVYLAIHAACAKVAHLSGAAECIDKYYRDIEDSTTLHPDGTSAMMLEHAIFELEARGYETIV